MIPLFDFDTYHLLTILLFVFGIQILVFLAAFSLKTDHFTDLTYGLTFVLTAVWLLAVSAGNSRVVKVLLWLIILWGVRLAGYLFLRIRIMGKDERFDGRRENFVSFLKFWIFQGVAIYLISLPFVLAAGLRPGYSFLAGTGFTLAVSGLLLESVADWQKFRFKTTAEGRNRWMDRGLYRFCRYPNYLGEIIFWWGIFLVFATEGFLLFPWALIGPVFITFLLLKVSGIPLLEQRNEKKYGTDPAYRLYRESTPLLLPFWRSRKSQ